MNDLIKLNLTDDLTALAELDLAHRWPWGQANLMQSVKAPRSLFCNQHQTAFMAVQEVAGQSDLLHIAVHSNYQGRGLGRALLQAYCEKALAEGIVELFLEVRVSNQAAIRLYNGMGFNELDIRKNYYPAAAGSREDALVMALVL